MAKKRNASVQSVSCKVWALCQKYDEFSQYTVKVFLFSLTFDRFGGAKMMQWGIIVNSLGVLVNHGLTVGSGERVLQSVCFEGLHLQCLNF